MLIQFKFKNHKSFYDENVLDLMATSEKRHIETTVNINGNKILPVIAIHGANASGKSGILEALEFMFKTIKESSHIDINQDLQVNPFAFSTKSLVQNSEYEFSICLGDYEYRYGFAINKDGFDEEWLYQKKFAANTRVSQKIIFERSEDKVEFGSSYKKYKKIWDLFGNDSPSSKKLLILSNVAIKETDGVLRQIYDYVCKFNFKIEHFYNKTSIDILTKDSSLYNKFQKIINEFDPCLLGIKIDEINYENGEKRYVINGIHKNLENNVIHSLIPLHKESDGTIKIFNIMPTILKNLEEGGLLCIDELDIKFHPLLFKKIVNMYKNRKINKNNAQLIYTAHSTFMFNNADLRRDQIYLVDKDKLGKSHLYSLSEFRNLRADSDYEKKYLTGQFGAIPFEDE